MLNRTILRSKALQLAYAYYSGEKANFEMAIDQIETRFSPDLNSLEVQDKASLKRDLKKAVSLFKKKELKDEDSMVTAALVEANNLYQDQNKQDYVKIRKQALAYGEKVFDLYLLALSLVVKLADQVQINAINTAKNRPEAPKPTAEELKLSNNQVIRLIKNSDTFEKACKKGGVSWNDQQEFVDTLFKQHLRKLDAYKAYLALPLDKTDFEADMHIVKDIFSEVIFGNDLASSEFESSDMAWFENKAIIKSMVKFTLKKINADTNELPFAPIAKNWEEDRDFYMELLEKTIKTSEEYEALIAEKTINWDNERIGLMDKIILKLALSEIQHFPSIPVKVSINEYIDLSKQFSTPKSKIFVNGILDKLVSDMKANGTIRKSGRGLIDNR